MVRVIYSASVSALALLMALPAAAQQTESGSPTQAPPKSLPSDGATAQEAGVVQATATSDASPASLNSDIIVTARRRDESLSKVPIAITALSSDAIVQQGIRSESDIQIAVPGLVVKQGGSSNVLNFAIRGQSIDSYTNSPPAVLPYVDQFQASSNSAASLFDIASIQVLKGPQGTLFGRNTTGGAVLYETVQPGDVEQGFFTVRGANYNSYQATAAATMPLADWASIRIAGNYTQQGGYIRNLYNNQLVGDNTNNTIRGTLRLGRQSGLRNTTVVQYGTDHGTNTPTEAVYANPIGATTTGGISLFSAPTAIFDPTNPIFQAYLAAHPGLYPGGLVNFVAQQRAGGPFQGSDNASLVHDGENILVINTTELPLGDNLTLKNIGGFNKSKAFDDLDYDGTPYPTFGQQTGEGQHRTIQQFSDELQLQGKLLDGALTFIVGAYYSNELDKERSPLSFFDLEPLAPPTNITYDFNVHDISYAGFAQATYNITSKLHFTGGFRYSRDDLTADNLSDSVFGVSHQESHYQKPSWTVSLDYQLTPQLLLYVTQRGSWRAGGYNFAAVPINATGAGGGNMFLPETTKDVEIGAKFNGHLGDMPLAVNLAGYNQWVNNIQRAAFIVSNGNPGLVTGNVPRAEVTGFEGDLTVRPARWLDLGVNGAYTDARFTDANTFVFQLPLAFGPYGDTPKFSGAVFGQVTKPLSGDSGSLSLRADVYGQTSFYFSNTGNTLTPGSKLPGYSLINLRLSWANFMGSKATVSLYAQNVGNRQYYVGGLPAGNAVGTSSASPGRPRMFGGEVRFEF